MTDQPKGIAELLDEYEKALRFPYSTEGMKSSWLANTQEVRAARSRIESLFAEMERERDLALEQRDMLESALQKRIGPMPENFDMTEILEP